MGHRSYYCCSTVQNDQKDIVKMDFTSTTPFCYTVRLCQIWIIDDCPESTNVGPGLTLQGTNDIFMMS